MPWSAEVVRAFDEREGDERSWSVGEKKGLLPEGAEDPEIRRPSCFRRKKKMHLQRKMQ